jgi:hypothetical protein
LHFLTNNALLLITRSLQIDYVTMLLLQARDFLANVEYECYGLSAICVPVHIAA